MRRITIVLDVAVETEGTDSPEELAESLRDDVEMHIPNVNVWQGRQNVFSVAPVTRVAVQRTSEQ